MSGVTRRRPRKTGPERFWDRRRSRIGITVAFVVSVLAHFAMSPWSLFPSGLEVRDVEGDTTIPIDVLNPGDPVAPAETAQEPTASVVEGEGPRKANDSLHDAGIEPPLQDAEPDVRDAEPPDAAEPDASDAAADAGPDSGPRDPVAMVGDVGKLQADEALVVLLINAQEIRKHPVGAQMGGSSRRFRSGTTSSRGRASIRFSRPIGSSSAGRGS